jgi:predicted nucleic acid-binding Zn ribbon protein
MSGIANPITKVLRRGPKRGFLEFGELLLSGPSHLYGGDGYCRACFRAVGNGPVLCADCARAEAEQWNYEGSGCGLVCAHGPHYHERPAEEDEVTISVFQHAQAMEARGLPPVRERECVTCRRLFYTAAVHPHAECLGCSAKRVPPPPEKPKRTKAPRMCPCCESEPARPGKQFCSDGCRMAMHARQQQARADYARMKARV